MTHLSDSVKLAFLLLWLPLLGQAQNPIVKDIGMSDPHARVFNDTLYLYTGHDDDPDDPLWVMKDWRVFATTDLTNWTHVSTISPADNYMGAGSIDAWASDASSRNGKYYFYFSDRNRSVGVMTADNPAGPFTDPLGKPLVEPRHDPTILIDDDADSTAYLIFGDKEHDYQVARLNDDMISLAEAPRPIEIRGEAWAKAPKWMDKNYVFRHDGTYYLSWGRDYATSKNIYGPYEGRGAVGRGHHLDQFAHGSFFEWKGQFYHVWCYYLQDGKKYRETIISYAHFTDDGSLVTDTGFLDDHFANGVGQYSADWERIEAEWYYEKPAAAELRKHGATRDSLYVGGDKSGDWLRYANVSFPELATAFTARVSAAGSGGRLEVRLDSPDGMMVAEVTVADTDGAFTTVETALKPIIGRRDVYLVFAGGAEATGIDWFSFGGGLRE